MNVGSTKILPLLTARYSILCTRRLQPPRDDCAVRVQWFSSVNMGTCVSHHEKSVITSGPNSVNSEIFARILFSLIAFKDIFAMFKIHD